MTDENSKTARSPNVRKPRAVQRTKLSLSGSLCLLFAALIALAPLPLGSARPLAWEAIGLVVALFLLVTTALPARDIPMLRRDLLIPLALLALVAAHVLFQVGSVAPTSWINPIWDQAAEALGSNIRGSIAVDRGSAMIDLFRLLTYAGVFYLSYILGRQADHANLLMNTVILSGAAYAAYALIVYWSGNRTILWFSKWSYIGDATGTFVNRNSFSTYLGLCMLVAFGKVVSVFVQAPLVGTQRQKFVAVVEFVGARPWLFLSVLLLPMAWLLTHSRGGFISTLGGMLTLLLTVLLVPSLRQVRRIGFVAIPAVLLIVAFFVNGGMTAGRIADTLERASDVRWNEVDGRVAVDELVTAAIGDHPILGTGFGSFEAVFSLYRTGAIGGHYDLAHNDYLQNLLELGIPAALVLFAIPLWLFGLCIRGAWVRRRDAIFPCLGIAGTVLVALHATVDFSLQIPAVTVTYMALMGLGVAQSRSSREEA